MRASGRSRHKKAAQPGTCGPRTHLACAAASSRAWRGPSQVSLPCALGTFQVWLPRTSSGESVAQPLSAAQSSGSAPLHRASCLSNLCTVKSTASPAPGISGMQALQIHGRFPGLVKGHGRYEHRWHWNRNCQPCVHVQCQSRIPAPHRGNLAGQRVRAPPGVERDARAEAVVGCRQRSHSGAAIAAMRSMHCQPGRQCRPYERSRFVHHT